MKMTLDSRTDSERWMDRGSLCLGGVFLFMVWTMFGSVATRLPVTDSTKTLFLAVFSGFGLIAEVAMIVGVRYCYCRADASRR